MNRALLYRQHGRSIFWIAFVSAVAIHIGAVAFAKTKSPTARLEDFSPLGAVDVDIGEVEPARWKNRSRPCRWRRFIQIRIVSRKKPARHHRFARIGMHGQFLFCEEQRQRHCVG